MIEIPREVFKNEPIFRKVYEHILKNHVVPDHTVKVLTENKHIKDFCEEARHFVMLSGINPIFLHYDIANWYTEKDGLPCVQTRIDSIAFYYDFMEYETARVSQLHGAKDKDIPNIN